MINDATLFALPAFSDILLQPLPVPAPGEQKIHFFRDLYSYSLE